MKPWRITETEYVEETAIQACDGRRPRLDSNVLVLALVLLIV